MNPLIEQPRVALLQRLHMNCVSCCTFGLDTMPHCGHILPWPVQNNRNEDLRSLVQQWWDFREVVQHYPRSRGGLGIAGLRNQSRGRLRGFEVFRGGLTQADQGQAPAVGYSTLSPFLKGRGGDAELLGPLLDKLPIQIVCHDAYF